jgi:hypothetical protein
MDIRVAHRTDESSQGYDKGSLPSPPATAWGTILAGAVVAIAMSLVMITLGMGLGFASISPWSNHGIGAAEFTMAAAIWLIVTQWVSSIFGGYMTGRLRTRWVGVHDHEVFFRDTANGLVMWALATVVVASIAAFSVWSGIGAGAKAASGVVGSALQGATSNPGNAGAVNQGAAANGATEPFSGLAYGLDKLFRPRSMTSAGDTGSNDFRAEASRILATDLPSGEVSDADRAYLVSLVAARTGVEDTDAQKRVSELLQSIKAADARVRAQADIARKDGVEVAIYTALALLIGAFIACVAAALGGRLRDAG